MISRFAVVIRGAALLLAAGPSTLAVREAHTDPGARVMMRRDQLQAVPVLVVTRGRP